MDPLGKKKEKKKKKENNNEIPLYTCANGQNPEHWWPQMPPNAGEDVELQEPSPVACRDANGTPAVEDSLAVVLVFSCCCKRIK